MENNKYAGMTVNERLYVSGLMDEFDGAVKIRDTEKIRAILEKVELTEESIKPILEKLGLKK
jgi:molecular chaperone GrpE (heat shock protein)